MLKEFKEFIAKGNVLELAVGLILATYFGAIIKSMVDDLLMPIVGNLLGGVDFKDKMYVLTEQVAEVTNEAGDVITEGVNQVAIRYGVFVNHIITFVIVAFIVFLIVRAYNKMKAKMEEKKRLAAEAAAAAEEPAGPSKEEVLLGEIRDLLKK